MPLEADKRHTETISLAICSALRSFSLNPGAERSNLVVYASSSNLGLTPKRRSLTSN